MSLFIIDAVAAILTTVPAEGVNTPEGVPPFILDMPEDADNNDVNMLKQHNKNDAEGFTSLTNTPGAEGILPQLNTLPSKKVVIETWSENAPTEVPNSGDSAKKTLDHPMRDVGVDQPEVETPIAINRFETANVEATPQAVDKSSHGQPIVKSAPVDSLASTVFYNRLREGATTHGTSELGIPQQPSSPSSAPTLEPTTKRLPVIISVREGALPTAQYNAPPDIQQGTSTPTPIPEKQLVTDYISIPQQLQTAPTVAVQESLAIEISPSLTQFDRMASNSPEVPRQALTPVPLAPKQIVAQISASVSNMSEDTLELRLDPPELGKLIVTLTHKGTVMSAHIMADRPDVLEFLRRNADVLSRELEGSGFKGATLEFSHRQDSDKHENPASAPVSIVVDQMQPEMVHATHRSLPTHQNGALDIRI